jgi:hypothetical protein
MSKISKSPDRHTFQKDGYIKRMEEKGEEPNPDYIQMYKTWREQDEENLIDPEWQKDNMEYDLRSTEWICDKVKESQVYSQNLYAAICNNDFQKLEVIPILKDQRWSASWRSAGGIIADMREEGDYIDWYCSGIRNNDEISPEEFNNLTEEQQIHYKETQAFVPESLVTDEIREDLKKLGWIVIQDDQTNNFI